MSDEQPPSEKIPYLEIGSDQPMEESELKESFPVSPESAPPSENSMPNRTVENIRSTPRHRLIFVSLALFIIIILFPRFLIMLSPVIFHLTLVMRLLLPLLVAIGIAWLILTWVRQNSR